MTRNPRPAMTCKMKSGLPFTSVFIYRDALIVFTCCWMEGDVSTSSQMKLISFEQSDWSFPLPVADDAAMTAFSSSSLAEGKSSWANSGNSTWNKKHVIQCG